MKQSAALAVTHVLLTIGGWYFVAAAAQGVADGTGLAPLWLTAAHYCVLALLVPLGLLARAADPGFGGFTMASFASFCAVAAVNSGFFALAVCLAWRRRRRRPSSHDA